MFRDQSLILSDAQALRGNGDSTNVYDQKAGVRDEDAAADIGTGNPLYLIVDIETAFAGATGLTVGLRQADANKQNPVALGPQVTFSTAELTTKGSRKVAYIPPEAVTQREIFASYVLAGTATAGAVNAWLSPTIEGYQEIKSGFTVETA